MPNLPCYQCHAPDQGIFEPIGKFLYFQCCSCGRNITAKHYRAEMQEVKQANQFYYKIVN